MVSYSQAPTQHVRVFSLQPGGSSFQAASAVLRHARTAAAMDRPASQGKLLDTLRNRQQFFQKQHDTLQKTNPFLLHELGLTMPVIQVTNAIEGLPRAYQVYPAIYLNQSPEPGRARAFYIYAPVDYRGRSFEPREADELKDESKQRIGSMLFADGWNTPPAVLPMRQKGVKRPDDFDLSRHYAHGTARPSNSQAIFVAEGPSLEMLDDFHRREQQSATASGTVQEYLKQAMTDKLGDSFRRQIAPGEGFYVETVRSRDTGRRCSFSIAVRRDGMGAGSPMQAGRPLVIPANPVFHPRDGEREYSVVPRDDTPEGRTLKKLIAAVPPVPSLGEYHGMRGDVLLRARPDDLAWIDVGVPRLQVLAGRTMLIYNRDQDAQSPFCPPGAIPLSTAAYQWLDADDIDTRRGDKPPPMPESLAREMRRGFGIGLVLGRPSSRASYPPGL